MPSNIPRSPQILPRQVQGAETMCSGSQPLSCCGPGQLGAPLPAFAGVQPSAAPGSRARPTGVLGFTGKGCAGKLFLGCRKHSQCLLPSWILLVYLTFFIANL